MTVFSQRQARRDNKSILGKETRLPGYPGLTFMAMRISEYIPKCKIYVEPFAGLGRLTRHINAEKIILNDKSPYAINYLKKYTQAKITNLDFEECINLYDSTDTFFLIDPPWINVIYKNNPLPYTDRTPLEYYTRLFEIIPKLKGDWILCSDKAEHDIRKICSKSPYGNLKLESNQKHFGDKYGVLLTSNKPFVRYQQSTLV